MCIGCLAGYEGGMKQSDETASIEYDTNDYNSK